ncbi:rhodanese-like domain-containing protein [Colwellia sp. TT2012]|uniref:rhodanese-like domain-containing protein n=1 Tax=Colwellia sp. TT2012 TaxID=1720342 RepID=UPI00070EA216|nr:rhodanese-like domain-containing protein [Colwellia sp. TT2012]
MLINVKELVRLAKKEIMEITCDELYAQLPTQPLIIDLREAVELENGLLPGAIHMPRGVLEMRITSLARVADTAEPLQALAQQNIYLYCQSDARSILAAQSLAKMGLNKVYSLTGGATEWRNKDLPFSQ